MSLSIFVSKFLIWKGKINELEEKVKELEDKSKGIKLKLEVEKENKITFLDIKLAKNEESGKLETEWHQKEESAEIYCNRRSDVDESNKRNVIKNLETKIEKLTTKEEQRKALKEKLRAQLENNGYK